VEEHDLELNLGMLCRCCDHTFRWLDVEGFNAAQRRIIAELCSMCVEQYQGTGQ
jgi:hypothetical protein